MFSTDSACLSVLGALPESFSDAARKMCFVKPGLLVVYVRSTRPRGVRLRLRPFSHFCPGRWVLVFQYHQLFL